MSVQNVINSAIYTKLTGGTALTALLSNGTAVYYLQAPDYATLPYVVWSFMAGGPTNDYPHDSRDIVLFVRGYATVPALAGTIDAQISSLLHRGTLSVTGYTNWWLARNEDVALIENAPDGTKVYMAGAQYQIRLDV
jgi:hypothetical protein